MHFVSVASGRWNGAEVQPGAAEAEVGQHQTSVSQDVAVGVKVGQRQVAGAVSIEVARAVEAGCELHHEQVSEESLDLGAE